MTGLMTPARVFNRMNRKWDTHAPSDPQLPPSGSVYPHGHNWTFPTEVVTSLGKLRISNCPDPPPVVTHR